MVDGGMRPVDALVATTATAAELLGVEQDLGTVAPGKLADLVMVEGDPYDVATLPAAIREVWKAGERVV
jgi:imidazolonepropionase-like amidohydrolase